MDASELKLIGEIHEFLNRKDFSEIVETILYEEGVIASSYINNGRIRKHDMASLNKVRLISSRAVFEGEVNKRTDSKKKLNVFDLMKKDGGFDLNVMTVLSRMNKTTEQMCPCTCHTSPNQPQDTTRMNQNDKEDPLNTTKRTNKTFKSSSVYRQQTLQEIKKKYNFPKGHCNPASATVSAMESSATVSAMQSSATVLPMESETNEPHVQEQPKDTVLISDHSEPENKDSTFLSPAVRNADNVTLCSQVFNKPTLEDSISVISEKLTGGKNTSKTSNPGKTGTNDTNNLMVNEKVVAHTDWLEKALQNPLGNIPLGGIKSKTDDAKEKPQAYGHSANRADALGQKRKTNSSKLDVETEESEPDVGKVKHSDNEGQKQSTTISAKFSRSPIQGAGMEAGTSHSDILLQKDENCCCGLINVPVCQIPRSEQLQQCFTQFTYPNLQTTGTPLKSERSIQKQTSETRNFHADFADKNSAIRILVVAQKECCRLIPREGKELEAFQRAQAEARREKDLHRTTVTQEVVYDKSVKFFEAKIQDTVKFAKRIPGFKRLHLDDQVALIRDSRLDGDLPSIQRGFNPDCKIFSSVSGEHSGFEEIGLAYTEELVRGMAEGAKKAQLLNLSEEEEAVYRAVVITSADRCETLHDRSLVDELNSELVDCLVHLVERNSDNVARRLGQLVDFMTSSRDVSEKHLSLVKKILLQSPMHSNNLAIKEVI